MHPHRRRKKRPNYGVRTVEVSRGNNGFGFTISGQQPCILSCIVTDSPAEVAGLRAGDFLISVNGTNVSKLPHDAVVNLIGNSEGVIKMAIAENYFSDSSDEELLNGRSVQNNRQRPKYPHSNKSRMQRCRASNFNSNVIKTANNISIDQDGSVNDFKSNVNSSSKDNLSLLKPAPGQSGTAHCVIINPSVKNNNDINNVSAMVNPGPDQARAIKVIRDLKTGAMFEEFVGPPPDADIPSSSKSTGFLDCSKVEAVQTGSAEVRTENIVKMMEKESSVECRAVVGYLGTIEMPKQIATSSKLQTVRSCIRKMRQEKRTPCTVLMTILPSCMVLRNHSGELLAEYPAKRINYVSCSSENDYRFFGLVTSATYPVDVNDYEASQNANGIQKEYDIAISNSCHVFMIDTQIIEHKSHIKKAEIFKINCTIDAVSGMCLEFPNNSEYIVNIIRIMYSLKPPNGFTMKGNIENISRLSNLGRKSCSPRGSNFVRKVNRPKFFHESRLRHRPDNYMNPNVRPPRNEQENMVRNVNRQDPEPGMMNGNVFVANSPQPSNHSEITTASSNSDSGIGFHNDCQNISDRILVVDFPNPVRNNFNLNAPHVYPAFQRDGNVKAFAIRDNPNRPLGVIQLNSDMDGQFLSNTTPVVEGFSGLGRPLNHGDPILLGNLPSQPTLQNMFLSKANENEASSSSHVDKHDMFTREPGSPHKASAQHIYSLTDSQKQSVLNKLAVRAMPNKYEYCDKSQDLNKSPKKVNMHDHSVFHHRSRSEDSPQYDPVYSEGFVCHEEHHYEIIHPEENNMCNENVSNSKKCNKTLVYFGNEFRHKYTTEPPYSEKPVDVPEYDIDYYMVDADQLNNSSVATCSYDDMSVTSSKSQDAKKSNFSVDDISLYSSKSHDEVVASSKLKQKVQKLQTSMDDILIFGKHSKSKNSPKAAQKTKDEKDNNIFLHPGNVVKFRGRKGKKSSMFSKIKHNSNTSNNCEESQKPLDNKEYLMKYKLSPKVFGLSRPSASVEDICKSSSRRDESREVNWGHLEGTASEPDLRNCRSDFKGSGGSPFGRWAGGSGRALAQRPHSTRRPGTLANSEHDMYSKQQQCEADSNGLDDNSPDNGPTSWAMSFERLLSDPCGVHALSAFLEREFSAENIHFWTACERYARSPPQDRPNLASALHARHLAEGAPEPVNVDSHARQLALERLSAAPPDLFLQAQKQIFNLMKFDSYPRFIKSDIHKECLLAKLQGRDPPYPGDPALTLGGNQHTPSKASNLKKSLSNAEDRRRKSLLPWHRKLRSKSRDRWYDGENGENRSIGKGSEGTADGDKSENNSEKDPRGSNSSLLTGWDVTKALNTKNCGPTCPCDDHKSCSNGKQGNALCRVRLPYAAASSSVVAVGGGNETVRDLIDKLLRKRALAYLAYEVYLPSSNKAIDVNQSSSILAGEEVTVEQRVIFKLDLPNRKVISVKSKPNKALGDVLRPILHKYGVGASGGLCVTLGSTMLELTQAVQVADGQRLHVALRTVDQTELTNAINMKASQENNNVVTSNNNNITALGTVVPSLDEITNKVFEELLQGKADKHSTNVEQDSIKSDNCSSEHSSGIFGRFLRRDDHRNKGVKIKKSNPPNIHPPPSIARSNAQSVSSEGGSSCCMEDGTCNVPQKPLIAKLRAGVRIQNAVGVPTELENTEFLENLKQIQRARLKDKTMNGNDNPMTNGQDHQKGKENLANGKIVSGQYVVYDSRTSNQSFVNGIPVAAQRITPPAQPIIKPSPAPRLSLGQGSPNKCSNINRQDSTSHKETDRASGEYSPTKSAFNSLDNTVIEKNIGDASSKNSECLNKDDKNPNKYQINLAQDYLSSSTSCSDGFARNCDMLNSSFQSTGSSCENEQLKNGISDPPPLPPKPKVLPIKPSNWGQTLQATDDMRMQEVSLPDVGVQDAIDRSKRTVYLDQPSSSFV